MNIFSAGTKIEASKVNENFDEIGGGLAQVFFGDGADGDVDMDGTNTYATFASKSGSIYTLTRDLYASNLIIGTGVELKPNGYRVFVLNDLTFEGTGKISAYGGNGGNGANGGGNGSVATGGTAGAQANGAGTLPASAPGAQGAYGKSNGGTETVGANGVSTTKGIGSSSVATPGPGGDGNDAKNPVGTNGSNSGTITILWRQYIDFLLFRDWLGDNARMEVTPSPGGAGGGGQGGSNSAGGGTSYCTGGAGGGSGAPGGIVEVFAQNIITVDGNVYIDVHGGNGGNGGAGGYGLTYGSTSQRPAGGGGGGAGGNGGVALVVYKTKTGTGTIDTAGGTGGAYGARQENSLSGTYIAYNGTAGGNGNAGTSKLLQVLL